MSDSREDRHVLGGNTMDACYWNALDPQCPKNLQHQIYFAFLTVYVRNSNTAQDKITSKQTRTTSWVVKAVNYYLGDTTTITTYHFHIQDYH